MNKYPQTDLLSSEQQFNKEVDQLRQYTFEERDALIESARNGDKEAREQFALSFMGHVLATARKYTNNPIRQDSYHSHVEFLDLVSLSYLAILENMDRAFERSHPISYLRIVINGTILNFLNIHRGLIATPRPKSGRPPNPPMGMVSLDAPLDTEDDDASTLKDLIPVSEPAYSEEKDHTPIYQALDTLTEQQRDVMIHLFGLGGHAPEKWTEYARRTGKVVSTGNVTNAKTKLRKILKPVYAPA